MVTLKNMPSLGGEAATEVALATRSRIVLGNFVSDIAKGEDVKLTNDIFVSEPIEVSKATKIDLNGHTVTASNTTPLHFTSGTSTIKGGTVIGASGVTATAITVSNGATLTIEDGIYSMGKDENGEGNSCIYSTGGTINITGGTFSSDGLFKGHPWVLNVKDGSSGKIEVTGGRFKGFDPSNPQTGEGSFVKSDYTCVKEDDYYVVVPESEVVEEFKNALDEGGNVTLPGNIGLTEPITISKDTTINFGGNTVNRKNGVGIIANSGKLVINAEDDGGIIIGSGEDGVAVMAEEGSTVEINGGTFKVGSDALSQGNACIYSTGGTITINGGTYESEVQYNGKYWVLNKKNGTNGKILVKGGRFKNFNPGQPNTDDDTSYLAEGYESKQDGSDWYVVAKAAVISRKSKKIQ